MMIKKLPKIDGRTFVCGDIHGSYDRVTQFLDFINFDKTKDRLIAVGDLVDRGPMNEECLELLLEPWFHSVKGNHEKLMVSFIKDLPDGSWWFPNGGQWGLKHLASSGHGDKICINKRFEDLVNISASLPLMISVERDDGSYFHVIHAELAKPAMTTIAKRISTEHLHDEEKFKELALVNDGDGQAVLWKRTLFGGFMFKDVDQAFLDNLVNVRYFENRYFGLFEDDCETIYSGHTVVKKPVKIQCQINLDTCAFGSYSDRPSELNDWCGLTFTEPSTGQFWISKPAGVFDQTLVVIEKPEYVQKNDALSTLLRDVDDNF